tara:strand:+ start:6850 stop:7152 length:303 start_codon:yes stop_codon:yes gene_type:complete
MSKSEITHMINVPDCTFGLFITHDGKGINISCGDFATDDVYDTERHHIINDIGDSLLLLVKSVIDDAEKRYLKENSEISEEDKEKLRNVIYVNFKPETKH